MRALYLKEVLADSPLVFYEFQDASGNPQDSSGNALHITSVAGTPDYRQAGPMDDWSILCTGGEGFTRAHVSTVTDNFTLECIVDAAIVAADNQIVIYNGNSGANGWGVVIDNNGTIQYLCGGVAFGASSAAAIEGLGFVHLAVKRAAGTWTYYVDGAVDTANAGTTAPGIPNGSLTISASSFQRSGAYYAIYESALSDARIAEHYAAWKSPLRQQIL